ncbi:MAG: amidase [Alphaproteobacteria bacterium]|nr:amidase [Alphaproteobacteria bacterium]
MSFKEYAGYDAIGLAALIQRREVSAAEVLEAALERADRHNPHLNAIVHRADDEARARARSPIAGPFQGVPFLVKDLYADIAGWPQSNGSKFFKGYVSKTDSELVRRFRQSGLVLFGKTNTPEFGITGTTEGAALGPCRNPWNTRHSAGGSSGGAAAAVAAGIVPMAHASDGLGSIRIPAACCGLVGLKVTRDRTPRDPMTPQTGLAVNHVVTRTMRDTAAMLDAIGFAGAGDPYAYPAKERPYIEEVLRQPRRLRIAFSGKTVSDTPLHPDVERALAATAKLCEDLGHFVIERPLRLDWRLLYRAQGAHSAGHFGAGMLQAISEMGREPAEGELEPLTLSIWQASKTLSADKAAWGTMMLAHLTRELLEQWEHFDVFLSPTMINPPPEIGFIDPVNLDPKTVNKRQAATYGFTPPSNMTGQPSLSLPLHMSAEGLPIGMMFTARYADEATLIRLGAQLEQARPWSGRKPAHWN